jgi:hypothetical protein
MSHSGGMNVDGAIGGGRPAMLAFPPTTSDKSSTGALQSSTGALQSSTGALQSSTGALQSTPQRPTSHQVTALVQHERKGNESLQLCITLKGCLGFQRRQSCQVN